MLTSFKFDHSVVNATMFLYLLLGVASFSVQLKTNKGRESQLRYQVNAWWLIFPVVTVSLFFYPLGPIFLTLLIGSLAIRELSMHFVGNSSSFKLICFISLVAIDICSINNPRLILVVLPFLIVIQLIYFSISKKENHLLFLMFLINCCGISFIIQLVDLSNSSSTNSAWLFYLFVLTALNDIGQFIAGKCFGKHQIASTISPNKTWQGLMGGIVVSIAVSVLLGYYMQLSSIINLMLLGIFLSIGGFAGDLLFSSAKRFLKIKDFSKLIPGHGGILDRVDSLVVTAPLLFLAMIFHI